MEKEVFQSQIHHQKLIKHKKSRFSFIEYLQLRLLVEKHGAKEWNFISSLMINRNSRQCNDRWENFLSPNVDLSIWSEDKDSLLIEKRREFGAHWVKILQFFPKRTDIALKNRWNFLQRTKQKNAQQGYYQNQNPQTWYFSEIVPNHTNLFYDAASIDGFDTIYNEAHNNLIFTNQSEMYGDFLYPLDSPSQDFCF
jgi:hypothetical protein